MPKAIFPVVFEDIDYESWAVACGASARLEPSPKGLLLEVEGTPDAIAAFSADIGWPPLTPGEVAGL